MEERKIEEVKEKTEEEKEKDSKFIENYKKVFNALMKIKEFLIRVSEVATDTVDRMGEIDKKFVGDKPTEEQQMPDLKKVEEMF